MPYTTEFTADGRGVLHVGRGLVVGAEVIAGTAAHYQDPERTRGLRYGLVDFSGVTDLRLTPADVQEIVAHDQRVAAINSRIAVAVIAPRDYMFGMARMWQMLGEATGWSTRVVATRAEADAWLAEQMGSTD